MPKLHTIEATVHQPVKDGYRVKVSILDLGVHINGMLAFPPNDKHEGWVVYPPTIPTRFRRIYPVEFNKKMSLWEEIYEACVAAVQVYQVDNNMDIDDSELTDEAISKGLDKAFDRFGKNES